MYPRRKETPLFTPDMAFYVLCWTYISPRSLLIWLNALFCSLFFLFSDTLYSGNINSWKSYHFSCLLDMFPVRASYFLLIYLFFVINSFHTQKSPKVFNLPLTDETLCLGFWRHKQEKWLFQFSKLSSGSYVSL